MELEEGNKRKIESLDHSVSGTTTVVPYRESFTGMAEPTTTGSYSIAFPFRLSTVTHVCVHSNLTSSIPIWGVTQSSFGIRIPYSVASGLRIYWRVEGSRE